MPKIMIINVTHAEESRVGIVTDGVLTSFEIESFSREHLKGNIYRGVVHRVQPGLEAAFVDIGADRDAFLPLDEICFRNLPHPPRDSGNGGEGRRRPRVSDVLKSGEEILVQIVKEQFANKPPTLSTYFSLAGRYLVLLPGSDEAGISRRIEGADRQRIRELIEKLEPPEGFGIIVRTVANFDPGVRELQRDLTYLRRLWDSIQQSATTKRAPALIYREHDLVLRNIRDYFTPDIDEVYIDNEEVFQRARDFFRDVMPEKESVLRLYQEDQPIFSRFNVEAQIESIYKRRVPLKSGGSIVIDGTEALTAIDVNSGRSVRNASQEETAFHTNLEAAAEIARQLRLRDLGGLIVIDFIDMRHAPHIHEVEKALRAAMHEDKARHELGRISQFGLLEVSRQRLRPAAAATSYIACPRCEGYGLVRTTESAALVALRKVHNRVAQGDVAALKATLPAEVGLYLLNHKREDLAQLERRYAVRIQIVLSERLMPHQSELETRARVEGAAVEVPAMRLGGVTAPEPGDRTAAPEESRGPAEASAAAPDGGGRTGAAAAGNGGTGKRKRRRGRRRGRGRQAAVAIGEALAALGARTGHAQTATLPVAPKIEPPAADSTGRAALDLPTPVIHAAVPVEERSAPVAEARPAGADAPAGAPPATASAPRAPSGRRRAGAPRRRSQRAKPAAHKTAAVSAQRSSGRGATASGAAAQKSVPPKTENQKGEMKRSRAAREDKGTSAQAKSTPRKASRTPGPGGRARSRGRDAAAPADPGESS